MFKCLYFCLSVTSLFWTGMKALWGIFKTSERMVFSKEQAVMFPKWSRQEEHYVWSWSNDVFFIWAVLLVWHSTLKISFILQDLPAWIRLIIVLLVL